MPVLNPSEAYDLITTLTPAQLRDVKRAVAAAVADLEAAEADLVAARQAFHLATKGLREARALGRRELQTGKRTERCNVRLELDEATGTVTVIRNDDDVTLEARPVTADELELHQANIDTAARDALIAKSEAALAAGG